MASRLRTQASQFAAHAATMEKAGLGQINIDGNKMLVRAMKQVDRFLRNAKEIWKISSTTTNERSSSAARCASIVPRPNP